MRPDFDLSLYLVTDRLLAGGRDIEWIVQEAVKGGVTLVQLREKDCSTNEFITLAGRLKSMLKPLGVPLIINDQIDVALAVDADGVHIGQSDMPYVTARRLLGPDKLIGLSVETIEEVEAANALDVDYLGISPVYATSTKTDTLTPFGLEGVRKVVQRSRHRCVAIGGMNVNTIGPVIEEGVEGVAVVSAIVSAKEPAAAAAALKKSIADHRLPWSEGAWMAAAAQIDRIKHLPLVQGLMTGELPAADFIHYLEQDMIYLGNYGKEMEQLSRLMPVVSMQQFFKRIAEEGVEAEEDLHRLLAKKWNVSPAQSATEVTVGYMNFSSHYLETNDPALAMAALLPCFKVYNEIGHYIAGCNPGNDHPYKEWIKTYESEEMDQVVGKVVEIANQLAGISALSKQAEMRCVFKEAVEWEKKFFNQ